MGTSADVEQLVWDIASIRCALARPVDPAVAAELRDREEAIAAVLREVGVLGPRVAPAPARRAAASQAWF